MTNFLRSPSRCVLAAMLVAGLATGCYGSVNFTGDTGLDQPDPDTAVDTGTDLIPDTAPDGEPDVIPPDTIEDVTPDWPPWDTWEDPWYDVPPDPIWDTWEDPWYDVPPDVPPSCINESCSLPPVPGASCCYGLVAVDPCSPWDPICVGALYCVNCCNGTCDPWEKDWNCSTDCLEASCDTGMGYAFSCGPYESHSCECLGDPCMPTCTSSGGMGQWMNPCTGEIVSPTPCMSWITPSCAYIGTDSEGWYVYTPWGDEILLTYAACAGELYCY